MVENRTDVFEVVAFPGSGDVAKSSEDDDLVFAIHRIALLNDSVAQLLVANKPLLMQKFTCTSLGGSGIGIRSVSF